MGDTEGRTESREEGERDSAAQLSDQHFQCLSIPSSPWGSPTPHMLERGSKLCSHLAPLGRKEELGNGWLPPV